MTPRGHSHHPLFLLPLGVSYAAGRLGEISNLHFNKLLKQFHDSVAQLNGTTTAEVQACLGVRRWHLFPFLRGSLELDLGGQNPSARFQYLSVELWLATVFAESWSIYLGNEKTRGSQPWLHIVIKAFEQMAKPGSFPCPMKSEYLQVEPGHL